MRWLLGRLRRGWRFERCHTTSDPRVRLGLSLAFVLVVAAGALLTDDWYMGGMVLFLTLVLAGINIAGLLSSAGIADSHEKIRAWLEEGKHRDDGRGD